MDGSELPVSMDEVQNTMTEDIPDGVRNVLFWNRVWMVILVMFALGWLVFRAVSPWIDAMHRVSTRWSGDTFVINTITGRVLITHLVGTSPKGMQVGARLPTPVFILDSEPVKIDRAHYDKLEWRNEGGMAESAPAVGSKVEALYVRLETSEWRDPSDATY